jgi:hypothetical protein
MLKRIAVVGVLLVTMLCFTACTGGSALPSVEEILEKTNQAMEEVTSLSCDMELDMYMLATTGTEDAQEMNEVNAEMTLSGTMDVENRQMQMEADLGYDYADLLSSSTESSISMNMGMALYMLDGWAYIMVDSPMTGTVWEKYEVPEETIQQQEELMGEDLNPAGMQALLTEISQVTLEGTENINGVDCYVLHITLDENKLWQKIEQEAQALEEEMPEVADIEALLEVVQGISIKQWIAKDTYYIAAFQVVLDIELDAEDMGYAEGMDGVKIDASFDAFFYDYNQPVNIVLPEGAENAIDIGSMYGDYTYMTLADEANNEMHNVEIGVLAAMVDNDVYELAPGGTVGPGYSSSVYLADGVTQLDIVPYLYSYLEATYTLAEDGHITSAMAEPGSSWNSLTFTEYYGWVE